MNSSIPIASIQKLVDYLFVNEQRNFEEGVNRGWDLTAARDHILSDVETVAWWLEHITLAEGIEGMTTAEIMRRNARRHLSELIEQLVAAHEQFKQANSGKVAEAYSARWRILGELEEFLGDAVVELSPDEMHEGLLPAA